MTSFYVYNHLATQTTVPYTRSKFNITYIIGRKVCCIFLLKIVCFIALLFDEISFICYNIVKLILNI